VAATLTAAGLSGVKWPPPLVIPPRRTTTIGGQRVTTERLLVEIGIQSTADVRAMLRAITVEQTAIQIRLDNPPQLLEVDGRAARSVDDAKRKTMVVFGTALAASAMREVELELAAAIARTTTPHTGRLGNLSNWVWMFCPKGGAARPVTSANPPKSLTAGDSLVLYPRGVPHATMVDTLIAQSGKLNRAPRKGARAAKAKENKGFLFWAAQAARRRAVFKPFAVYVTYSHSWFQVSGEIMTRRGTGMIVIRPRARGAKR
jgi:hypothetical protein